MFWRYIWDHEVWTKVHTIETKVDRDNISIAISLVLSVGESRWKTTSDFANHLLETRPIRSRLEWVGTTALGRITKNILKQNTNRAFEKTRFGGTTRTECGVVSSRAPGVLALSNGGRVQHSWERSEIKKK